MPSYSWICSRPAATARPSRARCATRSRRAGGTVKDFPALSRERMEGWIDRRAKELDITLAPGAAACSPNVSVHMCAKATSIVGRMTSWPTPSSRSWPCIARTERSPRGRRRAGRRGRTRFHVGVPGCAGQSSHIGSGDAGPQAARRRHTYPGHDHADPPAAARTDSRRRPRRGRNQASGPGARAEASAVPGSEAEPSRRGPGDRTSWTARCQLCSSWTC